MRDSAINFSTGMAGMLSVEVFFDAMNGQPFTSSLRNRYVAIAALSLAGNLVSAFPDFFVDNAQKITNMFN